MKHESIIIPQLGVNDLEAKIISLHFRDGETVQTGDKLIEIETSKTIFDVEATVSGKVVYFVSEGDRVTVNQVVGAIGTDLEALNQLKSAHNYRLNENAGDVAFQLTKKAEMFAIQHHISIDQLKSKMSGKVKVSDIEALLAAGGLGKTAESPRVDLNTIKPVSGYKSVWIYGGGKGGVTVKECLEAGNEFRAVGFLDDNPDSPTELAGLPVILGSHLKHLKSFEFEFVAAAIANGKRRLEILNTIQDCSLTAINTIHPTAFIAPSVTMGIGNYIKARAIVETNTEIGNGCLIDNGVTIAHDNVIKDGCHLAPAASLGSGITIGERCIIGIGASIATGVTIGSDCIISLNTSVVADVLHHSIVEGVPGKIIGKRK